MTTPLSLTPWTLTALVLTVLLLATTAALLWQQYRYRRLRTHYRSVIEERDKVLAATAQHSAPPPTTTFAANLNQAELTTRFQYPRLRDYGAIAERTAPERYRYAHRLSKSGMEAEQIASLLTISRHEAQQLVHLSRLSSS